MLALGPIAVIRSFGKAAVHQLVGTVRSMAFGKGLFNQLATGVAERMLPYRGPAWSEYTLRRTPGRLVMWYLEPQLRNGECVGRQVGIHVPHRLAVGRLDISHRAPDLAHEGIAQASLAVVLQPGDMDHRVGGDRQTVGLAHLPCSRSYSLRWVQWGCGVVGEPKDAVKGEKHGGDQQDTAHDRDPSGRAHRGLIPPVSDRSSRHRLPV